MSVSNETFVHPSAIISKGAQLGVGVSVGPFCLVGANVVLGDGTRLHSHVVVEGHTVLGRRNEIFPFASVGHAPQDLKYRGEPTRLVVGDDNRIRESVTLQPGTVQDRGETTIGSKNLFMAYTHVAHDCVVGDENVFANGMQLAGHVVIGCQTVIGALAGVHQFCAIGDLAMVAAGAMVANDVPPFVLVQGDRAEARGLNVVGLRRRGYQPAEVSALKSAYKTLLAGGLATVAEALEQCRLAGLLNSIPAQLFASFVENSKRGVVRPSVSFGGADPASN